MILIFTPKYEDMIFLITNLGGFPMNGRLLGPSEYAPFKAAGKKQATDFGYIKAPCSLFKGSPDVIYSWGEDLISENSDEIIINEKQQEQFENVCALLTNESLDSVYIFFIGERSSYVPKLFNYIKPATNSVFLAELESRNAFTEGAKKITVHKRTETQEIFKDLLENGSGEVIATDITCPQCKSTLYKDISSYRCKDCSFALPRTVQGREISDKEFKYILKHKKTPLVSGFSGDFYGKIIYEDGGLLFSKESEYKCPYCKSNLSVRITTDDYICENCGFILPTKTGSHILSKAEIRDLLSDKKSEDIEI